MEVGSSSLPGTTLSLSGGLAQLARAPALQAGGQRFESVILHFAPHGLSFFIYDLSFSECARDL